MRGQESRECQGRQEHGQFGTGTCDDSSAGAESRTGSARTLDKPAPAALDQRIAAVIHGAVGHLPRNERGRYEAWLDRHGAGPMTVAMRAWSAVPGLDREKFRQRYLSAAASDGVTDNLRAAAEAANAARTQGGLRDAGHFLAQAFQAVRSDQWVRMIGSGLSELFGVKSAAADPRRENPVQPRQISPVNGDPYPTLGQLAAILYNETSSLRVRPDGPDLESLRRAMAHVVLNRIDQLRRSDGVADKVLTPSAATAIFTNRVPSAVAAYNSSAAAAAAALARNEAPTSGAASAVYYNNRPDGSTGPNNSNPDKPLPFIFTFGPYDNVASSPHAPANSSYFTFFGPAR